MTTATATFPWSSTSTQAAQEAWILGVRDLFLAAGLQQTADTGQYTTGYQAISGGMFGYHVFRFPDALQSTTPIFIRAQYQVMASGYPSVVLTVGTGTDGAGTINSPARFDPFGGNQVNLNVGYLATGGLPSYACYVDGTFSCVLGYGVNVGNTNQPHNNALAALVVDRARDNTGAALAAGFLCEAMQPFSNGNVYSRSMYGPASPAWSTNVPALIPSLNAPGSADGAKANVFRHYMMTPGVRASLGSVSYFVNEFGALTPITVTALGAPHTYLPVGRAMSYWSASALLATAGADHTGMIRWE